MSRRSLITRSKCPAPAPSPSPFPQFLLFSVSLINLVEVLSGKSVGRYDKTQTVASGTATTRGRQQQRQCWILRSPRSPRCPLILSLLIILLPPSPTVHALSNIEKAFKLLAEEEVKLVNLGPEDIMKSNQRLVLGLVWTLILRYHINAGKDLSSSGSSGSDAKSARSELMVCEG